MEEEFPVDESVFLDSCAFDPKYAPENKAAEEIYTLSEKKQLLANIAHSTEKEIQHPHTPQWVKAKAINLLTTYEFDLNESERKKLEQIETILAGDGKRENIKSDARHIFEAQKYGADFITTDKRILRKAASLEKEFSLKISTPSKYLCYFQSKLMQHQKLKEKLKDLRKEGG